MGVVWRARDERLQRAVAIKLLPGNIADSAEARARMEREAQAASSLDHSNICTVYEIGEHEDQLFIAMACYDGQTLQQKLEQGLPSVEDAVSIAVQIARGLERAHEAGIVHRDLKPANVMLTDRGEVKLLDFGLAKWAGATELTLPGMMTGTPAYMSPEQVNGGVTDHRADVWALGVICYEMLAGRRPFRGDTMTALLRSILLDDPPSLRALRPEVSPALEQAVLAALRKERSHRPNDAGALRAVLEGAATVRVTNQMATLAAVSSSGSTSGSFRSLAVLPLADRSQARDQAYFCEGLADELITGLSRLQRFRVASRTACFQFGEGADIAAVGRHLKVDAVLEGSVRKSGDQLRIAVQLVDVASGYCIWSDRYDCELRDVFEIQERIAGQVVVGLCSTWGPEDRARLIAGTTHRLDAYEHYLRGRLLYWQGRKQTLQEARRMYERAIECDSGYALAYAGIADCSAWLYADWGGEPDNLRDADVASRKAVSLSPELAETHVSRGAALALMQEHEAARRAFEEALRLNPRLYEARYGYANFCFTIGDLERALEHYAMATALRPEDFQAPSKLAMIYRTLGRIQEQREARRKVLDRVSRHLEINASDARALYLGALALLDLGDRERGLAWVERAVAVDPDDLNLLYNVACAYAVAGEADKALDALERVFAEGTANLAWIEQDSDLDALRSHPRFAALQRRG